MKSLCWLFVMTLIFFLGISVLFLACEETAKESKDDELDTEPVQHLMATPESITVTVRVLNRANQQPLVGAEVLVYFDYNPDTARYGEKQKNVTGDLGVVKFSWVSDVYFYYLGHVRVVVLAHGFEVDSRIFKVSGGDNLEVTFQLKAQ